MKPMVLLADGLPRRLLERVSEKFAILPIRHPEVEPLPAEAREARALITFGRFNTNQALMSELPNLGFICCYGTGFEGVELDAARARGITVANGGTANATAVAEFTLGLIIASARDMIMGDRSLRGGRWRADIIERLSVTPGLAGRRLGIYGLGSIGIKIAERARPFEVDIGYHNRRPRSDVAYAYHPTLQSLAQWSDILVVAVRAAAGNRHSINAEILTALGPKGRLINISRGLVVDHDALCAALESGVIAGAALDVFENEPHVPQRLIELENVILTPHMAAVSGDAQRAQRELLIANLEAYFDGRPVITPVGPGE